MCVRVSLCLYIMFYNPPPMSLEEVFFLISGPADADSPLRGDGLCGAEPSFGFFISCKNRCHIHRSSSEKSFFFSIIAIVLYCYRNNG